MPTVKAVKAWQDSAGRLHATVEEWQQAELQKLLGVTNGSGLVADKGEAAEYTSEDVFKELSKGLLQEREALLAILTTGPRARPKARKAVGTTQPKRAARRNGQQLAEAIAAAIPHPADDIAAPRG